jgi:hypothetical protein
VASTHARDDGLPAAQLTPLEDRDSGQDRQRVEAHGLLFVADPAFGELEQQGAAGPEREAGQRGQDHDHGQRQAAGLLRLVGKLGDADRGVPVGPDLLERVDALRHVGQGLGVGAEVVLQGVEALQLRAGLRGQYLAPGLQYAAAPQFVIEGSYQFPVVRNTGPLVLRNDRNVLLGIRYLF